MPEYATCCSRVQPLGSWPLVLPSVAKKRDMSSAASCGLCKLPRQAQVAIRDAVQEKLPVFPECSGIKALTNHANGFRLRVGNYRVLFNFDGSIKLIRIDQVGKCNERTY